MMSPFSECACAISVSVAPAEKASCLVCVFELSILAFSIYALSSVAAIALNSQSRYLGQCRVHPLAPPALFVLVNFDPSIYARTIASTEQKAE